MFEVPAVVGIAHRRFRFAIPNPPVHERGNRRYGGRPYGCRRDAADGYVPGGTTSQCRVVAAVQKESQVIPGHPDGEAVVAIEKWRVAVTRLNRLAGISPPVGTIVTA